MRRLLSLRLAPPDALTSITCYRGQCPDVDTYVLWCVDRGRHSTPPSVAAFSRRCEVERRDGCIVRGRSHESRLRISLAGVCEVVQALVVDEAEGHAEPACAKWFRPCLLRDGGTCRTRC
jgi:hypothetical protein